MPHVDVGEFIVMPNHVHGIVIIRERIGDVERDAMTGDHDHDTKMTGDHDRGSELPVDYDRETIIWVDHDRDIKMPVDHESDPKMPVDQDRPLRRRAMPVVPVGSLGRVIRAYKSAITRIAYRDGLVPHGTKIWQRNYWDHVVRDTAEYARITDYIRDNTAKWDRDRFNRRP